MTLRRFPMSASERYWSARLLVLALASACAQPAPPPAAPPAPSPAAGDRVWSVRELIERRGPPVAARVVVEGVVTVVQDCWASTPPPEPDALVNCSLYAVLLGDAPYSPEAAQQNGEALLALQVREVPTEDASGARVTFEPGRRYRFRGALLYTRGGWTVLRYQAHEPVGR